MQFVEVVAAVLTRLRDANRVLSEKQKMAPEPVPFCLLFSSVRKTQWGRPRISVAKGLADNGATQKKMRCLHCFFQDCDLSPVVQAVLDDAVEQMVEIVLAPG